MSQFVSAGEAASRMPPRAYRGRPGLLLAAIVLVGTACRGGAPPDIEVEVRSVGFDTASQSPVVLLQDADRKHALPIWIGPLEAQSIAMQIEGISPPRPMTHDLVKTILESAGVGVRKVVINDLKGSTYYARIYLEANGKDFDIDSRPSDAIALAVRVQRPIFVANGLLTGDRAIDLRQEAAAETSVHFGGVTVQNLTTDLADHFELPAGSGVIVAAVDGEEVPGGLRRGDVILAIDGEAVGGVGDFGAKLRAREGEDPAVLSVQRGSARLEVELSVPAS
ncbi:DUF151 domain-containing protein [Candidatus Binatia bacterium]|nr:DUF151 domain-containing protein [Candidatus Binatia bacterium]